MNKLVIVMIATFFGASYADQNAPISFEQLKKEIKNGNKFDSLDHKYFELTLEQLNQQDSQGCTLVMMAIQAGYEGIVYSLLCNLMRFSQEEAEASLALQDNEGRTALDYAKLYNLPDVHATLLRIINNTPIIYKLC